MTFVRRLPYLTFAGFLVLSVAFSLLSLAYEKKVNDRQNQQIDPKTGTWYPSYDWQAENRKIEISTKARVAMLWVLVAHGVFNAMYASVLTRGWRGIVLGLAFLVLSGFLALILVVGSVSGPAMVGMETLGFRTLADVATQPSFPF